MTKKWRKFLEKLIKVQLKSSTVAVLFNIESCFKLDVRFKVKNPVNCKLYS